MMMNNTSTLEADLDYAERMVRKGYGTAEQAAQVCGVCLADLQARLARGTDRERNGQEPRS
jgi:hypothetical protein